MNKEELLPSGPGNRQVADWAGQKKCRAGADEPGKPGNAESGNGLGAGNRTVWMD